MYSDQINSFLLNKQLKTSGNIIKWILGKQIRIQEILQQTRTKPELYKN